MVEGCLVVWKGMEEVDQCTKIVVNRGVAGGYISYREIVNRRLVVRRFKRRAV